MVSSHFARLLRARCLGLGAEEAVLVGPGVVQQGRNCPLLFYSGGDLGFSGGHFPSGPAARLTLRSGWDKKQLEGYAGNKRYIARLLP